jgi:hypothetical protein
MGDKPLKVLGWDNGSIRCQLSKPLVPGVYDVTILPKGSQASLSMIQALAAFEVKPPEIDQINPGTGTAGDQITIHGRFFGTKKGKVRLIDETDGSVASLFGSLEQEKVYLSYVANGKPKKKSCPIVSWTVDPETQEGEIVFVVPKDVPPGAFDISVTNKVGSNTKPAGFTIR